MFKSNVRSHEGGVGTSVCRDGLAFGLCSFLIS